MTLLVALWLARIAATDLATHRIPNALLWPGIVAVAASSVTQPAIAATALATGAPYLVGWVTRRVGGGDVKLAAVLGGLAGHWSGGLQIVLLAALGTLVLHALTQRRAAAPHGPALIAAAMVTLALPS